MAPEFLPEPIAVASFIASQLTRLGIGYVIGGSFASSVHGEPRSTNDVDIVADLHENDIDPLVHAIESGYYVARDAIVEAVRTGGAFNVIHVASAVKVDIFVAGDDTFDHQRLKRRIPVQFSTGVDAIILFVDTAEDTILRKLEWYRRGGEASERQWRDVVGILRTQKGQLDRSYMGEWATRLGVVELLERASI